MKGEHADLVGQVFGRLTVIRLVEHEKSGRVWEVRCTCGNTRRVRTGKLRSGDHKSCGCLRIERMKERHIACRVEVINGKKHCSKCRTVQPVENFAKSNKTLCGLAVACRACHRRYELQKNFGLSQAQFDAMLQKQKGVCAGCKREKKLHVDHDHQTGKVRGLLCGGCNRALGMLEDNPSTLRALIRYLTASCSRVDKDGLR